MSFYLPASEFQKVLLQNSLLSQLGALLGICRTDSNIWLLVSLASLS
jgi:hypothetical protein